MKNEKHQARLGIISKNLFDMFSLVFGGFFTFPQKAPTVGPTCLRAVAPVCQRSRSKRDLGQRGRSLRPFGKEPDVSNEPSPIDPNRLSIEQAVKMLSAVGKIQITREQLLADIEAGAPHNADGTINLVHYAAWIVKEMGRGD